MFTKAFNAIFMTRPFWNEVNVPQRLVLKIYKEYLGTKNMIITSRAESIKYISPIVNRLQREILDWIKSTNTNQVTLVVIIIDVVLIISATVIQPAYPKQLRFTSNEIRANVKKKNLVLVFVLIVQIAAIFFGNKTILTYSFFGVMLTVVSVLIQKFKREDEHFDEGRKSS